MRVIGIQLISLYILKLKDYYTKNNYVLPY